MNVTLIGFIVVFIVCLLGVGIYLKRRREASFEEIVDALGLEVTAFGKAEGRREGRGCRMEYRPGGRRRPSWLHLRLDTSFSNLPEATFRREGWFDRIGKVLGLSREHQAGRDAFDETIYVEGDREELESLIADPELRKTIRETVKGEAHSLYFEAGRIGVKIKNPFGLTGSVDATTIQKALDALGAAADALAGAMEDVPKTRPTPASVPGKTGEKRNRVGGLLMVGTVVSFIVGIGLLFVVDGYPLFTADLFWQGVKVGGILAGLYGAMLFVVNRRRATSTSHRTFLISTLFVLVGLPLTVYGTLVLANVFLDPNPPAWIPARVDDIDYDDGQYTAELRATFSDVRGRPEVAISDRAAERLEDGDLVRLKVGPGYLDEPWVAELRPSEKPTD